MKKPQEGKINFLGRTKILIQNRILYPRKLFKKKQLRVKNILKIGNKNEGITGEKRCMKTIATLGLQWWEGDPDQYSLASHACICQSKVPKFQQCQKALNADPAKACHDPKLWSLQQDRWYTNT